MTAAAEPRSRLSAPRGGVLPNAGQPIEASGGNRPWRWYTRACPDRCGREGMSRYFAESEETWETFNASAEEFRDLGDRVLVLGRMRGRGRASGVEVDTEYAMVVEFRVGRVCRSRGYLDRGEALRAALEHAARPCELLREPA